MVMLRPIRFITAERFEHFSDVPVQGYVLLAHVLMALLPITGLLLTAASKSLSFFYYLGIVVCPLWMGYGVFLLRSKSVSKYFRRRVALGYLAGFLATIIYSIVRIPAVSLGVVPDVALMVGHLAVPHSEIYSQSWLAYVVGYSIHFFLHGSAWGSIFALLSLPKRNLQGIAFGLLIGMCFLASPVSSLALRSSPISYPLFLLYVIVLFSHAVYGASLQFFITSLDKYSDVPHGMAYPDSTAKKKRFPNTKDRKGGELT